MDPRARWQALQAHLSAARFALKMGDKEKAREEVETALSIDPEFLAARLLRDQLSTPEIPAVPAPVPVPAAPSAPSASLAASAAALAQLEERVKQRVREREAAPARTATPATPRRAAKTVRAGALAAAGVAFAVAVSSNGRVREPQLLTSRAITLTASLVDAAVPDPVDFPAPASPAIDDDEPLVVERPFMRPVPTPTPARVTVSAPVTAPFDSRPGAQTLVQGQPTPAIA
ncbi:MAG TPA: tetratricopeptide repeat protein, partial [Vicinamibacterales bacterium]|nr:tetratricopeptide repeat protein [Vicinamibacterales bacterium]